MSTDGPAFPTGSAPCSATTSPRSRRKFLCSHGGKILPRPSDGHLKYVGGETRVFNVSRDISFQEVMKKLTSHIDGELLLKYEVASEDLDTLVSVRSDEDLRNMFEEIDRYETAGIPRLRAFLFPINPLVMENQMGPFDPHALEQRYIDAINGIIRLPPYSIKQHPAMNAMQQGSLVSSACSSPRSAEGSAESLTPSNNTYNSRNNMFKVQSSPNICSMNIQQQNKHIVHQLSQQHVHPSISSGWQSPKQLIPPERLVSARSMGCADGVRYQVDPLPPNNYYTPRQVRGNGCCSKCTHCDEWGQLSDRRVMERMGGSHVLSPVSSVTRLSHSGTKGGDGTAGGDM